MKFNRYHLLKGLSITALFFFFYPLCALLSVLFFRVQGIQSIWLWLYGVLNGLFSLLLCCSTDYFYQKDRLSLPIAKLFRMLFLLVPLVFIYRFQNALEWKMALVYFILSIIYYLAINRAYFRSYEDVIGRVMITISVVSGLAVAASCWMLSLDYQVELLALYVVIALSLYGVIRNQYQIDYMMERRRHRLKDLPQKIRSYNLKLLIVILVVVLIGFGLRSWIVMEINWVLLFLRDCLLALMQLIGWLFRFGEEETTIEPPADDQGVFSMPAAEEGTTFPFQIIFIIVIVALLIYYRKFIIDWVSERLQRLIEVIREQIYRVPINRKREIEQNEYYSDKIETISSIVVEKRHLRNNRYTLRHWKREYNSYQKMPQGAERFDFGYGLMIRYFILKDVSIKSFETPMEIVCKEALRSFPVNKHQLTEYYYLLHYSKQKKLDKLSFEQLDQMLTQLSEWNQSHK